ncbi:MAG: carbamate kinase [bacterium]|nr:carbamate kinase [bacterium]
MTNKPERVVVALGGNAILQADQRGTAADQRANVAVTAGQIADLIANGWEVVVTHGNGPQVGNILIQNEEAAGVVPAMPLDVCGAQSQGQLGYFLQQALANLLRERNVERPVVTLVSQVVVSRDDPAFDSPTKPIGPFCTRERAERLMRERGYVMREAGHRGWRRVVPSPEPETIVERDTIKQLIRVGTVVIAVGGGGIPVFRRGDGRLEGVEAVIDKDLAGQRLALDVGATHFLILTDVDRVFLDYGGPRQRGLDSVTVATARRHLAQGQFAPGSMGPKMEAAVRFVENGGKLCAITSLDRAAAALRGEAGTSVVPC